MRRLVLALSGLKNGLPVYPGARFLFVLLLTWVPVAPADELADLQALADAGAPRLALQLLDRRQPEPRRMGEWLRWERLRLEILKTGRDWQGIVDRAGVMREHVPGALREWLETERASALLELERGNEARTVLRTLLWEREAGTPVVAARRANWRRLLINSYLQDELIEDAHRALSLYGRDFGVDDAVLGADWERLRAQVLLRAGRSEDVLAVADREVRQDTVLGVLRLTAQLRIERVSPRTALARARRIEGQPGVPDEVRLYARALAAEAASAAKHHQEAVRTLTALLRQPSLPLGVRQV